MIRNLMLTAAVLTLGAAADGQSTAVAKIPFSFRITGADMPAGKYTIESKSGGRVMHILNVGTGRSAFLMVRTRTTSKDATPRLVFNCRGTDCALSSLYLDADRGWEFSAPRIKNAETDRLATVFLHTANGQ